MKLKIEQYIIIVLAFLAIYAFFLSFELGMLYLFLWLQTIIYGKILSTRNVIFTHIYSVLVISIIIVYYLRPLLLYQDLSFYYYSFHTGNITKQYLLDLMYKISFNSSVLLLSYVFFVFVFARNRRRLDSPGQLSKFAKRDYILLKGKIGYLTNLLLFISGIRFFLILVLGVGMKGVAITSSFAFLARLAPEEFVIGVLFTIFIIFRNEIDSLNRTKLFISLAMVLVAFVATGSKAVLILILFFFLVYYLYYSRRISIRAFTISCILIIVVLPLTFYLGNAVKTAAYLNDLNLHSVWYYTVKYTEESDIASAFDVVTNRFIGVDGYIAKQRVNSSLLYDIFSIKQVIKSSFYMLIPFAEGNFITSGVAVGRIVENFGENVVHAGALGGYSALELMFHNIPYVGVVIFSFISVLLAIALGKIKSLFIRFIMFFFLAYFLLLCIMSGNFDACISMFLLKIVLFYVYFYPVYKFKILKSK